MSWTKQMIATLDALESRTNPLTEDDIKNLALLGSRLEDLTAKISTLSGAEKDEAEPQLPTLMLRIQTVMDTLERNRNETSDTLTAMRQRQTASRAYQK